jgi:hypothetical protein
MLILALDARIKGEMAGSQSDSVRTDIYVPTHPRTYPIRE